MMTCKKLTLLALALFALRLAAYAQTTPVEGDFIARDFKFESGETLPELKLITARSVRRSKTLRVRCATPC